MRNKCLRVALSSWILLISCYFNIANASFIAAAESGYTQIYGLDIGVEDYNVDIPYYFDISLTVPLNSFNRIAYHMKLESSGVQEWIWVSMDAFTNDASEIGVPSLAGSNTVFQEILTNMNVFTNKAGINTGTGLAGGNIEFWPYNYTNTNSASVPNASNGTRDEGDDNSFSGSYGSMQIHNSAASQTLFSLNRFSGSSKDLGIGNYAGTHSDWTFAQNSADYTVKTLDVYVSSPAPITVPSPNGIAILALGLIGVSLCSFKKQA